MGAIQVPPRAPVSGLIAGVAVVGILGAASGYLAASPPSHWSSAPRIGLAIFSLACVYMLAVLFFVWRRFSTTVSSTGITLGTRSRTESYAWSEISQLKAKERPVRGGGRKLYCVGIELAAGTSLDVRSTVSSDVSKVQRLLAEMLRLRPSDLPWPLPSPDSLRVSGPSSQAAVPGRFDHGAPRTGILIDARTAHGTPFMRKRPRLVKVDLGNGLAQRIPWGQTFLPLGPGTYQVRMSLDYAVLPRVSRASANLSLHENQVVSLDYSTSRLPYGPGRISVLSD